MKCRYKITASIIIAALLGMGVSCTKDFEKINTNPTLLTKDIVQVNGFLTRTQKLSVFDTHFRINQFTGAYNAPDNGFPLQLYEYGPYFNGFYNPYLISINELIRLTKEDPNLSNKNAIAKITRAWLMQKLTDAFGDVPFSEAAGPAENIILQPSYDTQESIYRQLFEDVKEATAQLSNSPDQISYGAADLFFGGDVDLWTRFANSLRLRMAMRVRYIDPGLAKTNIDEVINQPLIETNNQNAKLLSEPSNSGNSANYSPIINELNGVNKYGLIAGFPYVELLKTKTDPRLSIYFKPSNAGGFWRGRPVNLGSAQLARYDGAFEDSSSSIGDYFRSSQFTFNILTAAEVSFLRAEAALFGITSENAQTLFSDGISKAMEMVTVAPNDITSFLSTGEATLTGIEEDKLKQIIEQKFISLWYQSDEAWAEYRRTGYPLIWIGSGSSATNGAIPRRLTYAGDEYLKNEAKVTEAAGRLTGGDKLTSRLWWDVKPGLPYSHPRQGLFPPETW